MMIHASVDADLLDPTSWTVSKSLAFNTSSWIPASWGALTNPGFLEGNAVEGPDGSVLNILRLNSEPVIGNKAVMTRFDPSSNSLRFERIIDLPGGHTKFVIRRHEPSKLYFTLSNNNTDAQYEDQRNVLCLCVSADLITWTIAKTLLEDDTGLSSGDSVRYTGFHYVDWQCTCSRSAFSSSFKVSEEAAVHAASRRDRRYHLPDPHVLPRREQLPQFQPPDVQALAELPRDGDGSADPAHGRRPAPTAL